MIEHNKIDFKNPPNSLTWKDDILIDWTNGGNSYHLDGKYETSRFHLGFNCDGVVTTFNDKYIILYKKLGTKGIILKDNRVLREINRSYYCADSYEYPISTFQLNGRTILAHCPDEYNKIEFEDIETGERLTKLEFREPDDYFHSRLKINTPGRFLISSGWYWHPYGSLEIYDIQNCLDSPKLPDKFSTGLPINGEVGFAGFINDRKIIIGMTNEEPLDDKTNETDKILFPNEIGILNIESLLIEKKIKYNAESGNLIPLNEDKAWSLYEYPKIIDLNSGQILYEMRELFSGLQDSSIIGGLDKIPPYAFDSNNKRLAIGTDKGIEILTFKE